MLRGERLLDSIVLNILGQLQRAGKNGLRYKDIRDSLGLSDSTLANRILRLKSLEYIELKAQFNEKGRNFIVYTLTEKGKKAVDKMKIEDLLEAVDELLA